MGKYEEWISAFLAKHNGFVRGKCKEAADGLAASFPELRVAEGFAHWQCPTRSVRDQHWWCVDPAGAVIDPSVAQFGGACVRYEELDLDDPETRSKIPTGPCMNCPGEAYEHRSFCSDACEAAVIADLKTNRW